MKITINTCPRLVEDRVVSLLKKHESLFPNWVTEIHVYGENNLDFNASCNPEKDYLRFSLRVNETFNQLSPNEQENVILHEIAHCYTSPAIDQILHVADSLNANTNVLKIAVESEIEQATQYLANIFQRLTTSQEGTSDQPNGA